MHLGQTFQILFMKELVKHPETERTKTWGKSPHAEVALVSADFQAKQERH